MLEASLRHDGMDAFACKYVLFDGPDQRHQGCGTGPDPVSERRGVEINAFIGKDVTLPVEW